MDTNGKLTGSQGYNGSEAHDSVIPVGRPESELIAPQRHSAAYYAVAAENPQNHQVRALLSALRRRWFLALLLGLLLGAAAGAAAWRLVPTLYTAVGELRIDLARGDAPWNNNKSPILNLDSFRLSMTQQIKEPFVINAALRDKVTECLTLRKEEFKDLWLQKQLDARPVGTSNIRVSLTGERPGDLALIVNSVLDAFITRQDDLYLQDRRSRLAEIRIVQAKESIERAKLKDKLGALNRQIEAGSVDQTSLKVQLQNEEFAQLQREYGTVRLEMIQKGAQLAALDGENPESVVGSVEIPPEVVDGELSRDRSYQEIAGAALRQQSQVATYQRRTRPENPSRIAAEEKLKSLEAQLNAVREQQLPVIRKSLLERVSKFTGAPSTKDQLNRELARLKIHAAEYLVQLERKKIEHSLLRTLILDQQELIQELADVDVRVKLFEDDVRRRENELEYEKPPIKKHIPAEIPRLPDETKRIKMAGLSAAGAFLIVAALIVWLEYRTRRISTAADVEQQLRLPVVGRIPLMPSSIAKSTSSRSTAKTVYWHSVLTESVDSARTMLLRLAKMDGMKTVMIASAMGGEGKTTLACHLATSLARGGRRVLLIDCDIRAPSVHEVFEIPNRIGFCEVLSGVTTLANTIVTSNQPLLSILPAGHLDQVTLQRLALDQFGPLLKEACQEFDFVIVDSAPILPVTDSLLLAPHVDGIIMSVRRDVSRMTKVAAAVQRLMMLGSPILGVVTIGLDAAEESYYYSKYHTYHPRDRRLQVEDLQSAEA